MDYGNLLDEYADVDKHMLATEAGKKLSRILFAHSADIVLSFKAHAMILLQLGDEHKERAEYLFHLADDINNLIKNAGLEG